MAHNLTCCFCCPVKNSAAYLDQVFFNLQELGGLFVQYKILFFYEESTDETESKLLEIQKKDPDHVLVRSEQIYSSTFYTWNQSNIRNYCLNFVRSSRNPTFDFFAMLDANAITATFVRAFILKKYLKDNRWDALSFNTYPVYFDTWALSIYPYCFSHNHFKNPKQIAEEMQNFVSSLLKGLPKDQLLPCISAFNGFAIYRLSSFKNCEYNGKLNLDEIPKDFILSHGNKAKSNLIYQNIGRFHGKMEDCEHRSFHIQAHMKNKAKIMISPFSLFIDYGLYLSLFDV